MSLVLEVCQYLRAQAGMGDVFVSNRQPSPPRDRAVIVTLSGGFKVNAAVDSKSIDVKVYETDYLEADELSESVLELLDGMTTPSIHDCWPVMLPADSVDAVTGAPIKFFRFRVLSG